MEIDEGPATVDQHANDEGMEACSVGPLSLIRWVWLIVLICIEIPLSGEEDETAFCAYFTKVS